MLLNYFPNSTISFRSNIFFHIGPLGVNCSFYKSKLACQSSCLPKSKRYIEIEAKFSLEVGRKAIPWKDATKAQERDDKKCKCFTSLAVVIIIIAAFLATALSALILAALFRESRIASTIIIKPLASVLRGIIFWLLLAVSYQERWGPAGLLAVRWSNSKKQPGWSLFFFSFWNEKSAEK